MTADERGVFRTTHWTEILDAGSKNEPTREAALQDLVGTYWKPVYCYLRRRGQRHEEAKDLTQGFFHQVVLGRSLIEQAKRSKGRFRTFLLTALDRYAEDVHRAEKAKQRMPEGGLLRLDGIENLNVSKLAQYGTPAEVFDYTWATLLLDQVLADVEGECVERDMAMHWRVFQARVLEPILDGAKSPSLTELCAEYGISNEAAASNMVVTVKRRFKTVLRHHVRQLVNSEEEVEDEIREVLRIFCGKGAGY
jgi:RNA polymerase sigma-70 factor (ECF subfamily)